MTLKEIYLWYCKEKGVTGEVIRRFYHSNLTELDRDGIRKPMSLDKYLKQEMSYLGLKDMFPYLFLDSTCLPISQEVSDKYKAACRQWRYFVKNNVKVKPKYKEGDKVTYSYDRYDEHFQDTSLVGFNDFNGYVSVRTNGGYVYDIPTSIVKTINGEPFELDFYIERRGKRYGFD